MDERAASIPQLQQQLLEKDQRISQLQVSNPRRTLLLPCFSPSALQSLVEIAFSGQADKVRKSRPFMSQPPSLHLQHVASAGWIEEVCFKG